jgi:hypothetical protein
MKWVAKIVQALDAIRCSAIAHAMAVPALFQHTIQCTKVSELGLSGTDCGYCALSKSFSKERIGVFHSIVFSSSPGMRCPPSVVLVEVASSSTNSSGTCFAAATLSITW